MMLQPIHNQRVLPAQLQQTVLPAVTVDTTEIHKQIAQMYNRTIIMPETHTYEVTHYVQTPQGLVKQPEPITNSSSIVAPGAVLPQQQLVVPSLVIPQPQVLIPQVQVVVPQVQAVVPQTQIVPQASVVGPQYQTLSLQPISSLAVNQRNSLIQPLAQSVLINPAPQLATQPLIGQSFLAQPLSVSYNPAMVMNK